jgi:hypothetical protein
VPRLIFAHRKLSFSRQAASGALMSLVGHQRRFEHAPGTSALPPIPDVLLSRSLETRECASLINLHKTAVADYVRRQDCSEPTLYARLFHFAQAPFDELASGAAYSEMKLIIN